MMSSARSRLPTNSALELVHTAKLWLLGLIETTNNPPPSLWGKLPFISSIPYLGTAVTTQQNGRPHHKTSIEFYIAHLKKNLNLREAGKELEYLKKLKAKLMFPVLEKDQKLSFLVSYYETLNQLASEFTRYNAYALEFSGQNEPRIRIIKTLKDHYESDSALAAEIGLSPALLDKQLEERQTTFNREPEETKPRFSTEAIQLSMNTNTQRRQSIPPPSQTQDLRHERSQIGAGLDGRSLFPQSAPRFVPRPSSPRPSIILSSSRPPFQPSRRLFSGASASDDLSLPPLVVINESVENNLSGLVDEAKTLAQYKKACENYSIHLLSAILDELENTYDNNIKHSLFGILTPREGNAPKQIARALLDSYYPANNVRHLDAFLARTRANERKQMDIDLAIHATRPQFHDAWEKYKLVKKLSQSQSVYGFHRTLNEGRNKEILTKRRDSHLMTFAKLCGLAVITILGLPLGIVGGAYLGYRSLFGSRATEGHLFLKKIDKLTEEGKKPPGLRRCC